MLISKQSLPSFFEIERMKNLFLILLAIIILPFSCTMEPPKNVNPNATKEARHLLNFLYEIQGKYTLSGQHNFIATGSKYTDTIKMITGKTPIVFGSDFSFSYDGKEPIRFQHCGPINIDDPGKLTSFEDLKTHTAHITDLTPQEARSSLVKNAIEKYREGFIITLMWHACPPGFGDHCDGRKIWAMENRPSQEEWGELTTEGTALNNAWKSQADNIASYLNDLKEAGVPVLWRPYHEMNGVWFWWCNQKGENGFKKLWIMMYDYYVNHHKLDNLIWVWNTNAPRERPGDEAFAYADFWPGTEYVDVLAADVYRADWKQSHHNDLLKLANGKPIAIGEAAPPPTPEVLSDQNYWTWFMPWGNLVFWGNGTEIMKELMKDNRVLSKEEVMKDSSGKYHVINK
jgi:mannan endo-1,4-beta-mannosidase